VTFDPTVDNTVIDYTAISSMLQSIKSHDDLFLQLSNGSMGSITKVGKAGTAGVTSTIPASQFTIASVQLSDTLQKGTWTGTVNYGQSFIDVPTITTTVFVSNATGTAPVAYLSKVPGTTECTVTIVDAKGASVQPFTLHLLAFGKKPL
jgi:hypothetical protein